MAADEVAANPRRRRWLRWVLIAAGVLAVAAIALPYLFLPLLARPVIERTLSAALDAPVSIGALSWEPENGRVTAERITIGDDADANHATVARVVGEVRLARLWQRDIVVRRVTVSDPAGVVELDDQYRPTMLPRDDDGAAGMLLPRATIEQLEVTGGRFIVRYPVKGRLHDTVLRIARLDSSDITVTADGVAMQASLEGALDEAPLNAQLRVGIDEVDADLTVSGLPVHRDAIDLPAGFETFRTTVDARAHYRSRTEPPSHTVQLDARLDAPSITDAAGSELSAAAIVVPDARVDLLTRSVAAEQVTIEKPVGELRFDASYQPTLPRFGADGGVESPAWNVVVRTLVATDGTLMLRYPVRETERAVPLRIARLQASDVNAAGGALTLRAELDGSLDGAPLTGRVDLGGANAIAADLGLSGFPVDAGSFALPAGLETFAAKIDVQAQYRKTAPASETVQLSARFAEPRLAGTQGSELRAAAVAVPQARLDLVTRRVQLGAVEITAPRFDITITSDGVILPLPRPGESTEPGWTIESGRVALRDGQVRVRRGEASVALRLQAVDWDGLTGSGPLDLRATTDGGGTITARGTVGTQPPAAELDVAFTALPLPPLAAVAGVLPLGLSKGTGEGRFHVVYADGGLSARGEGSVRDVHTLPPNPARPVEVMAVAEATADLAVQSNGATAIDVTALKLSYPYLLAQRHREGIFPADVFAARASTNGAPPAAREVTLRVRRLEAEHGKVEFVDTTLEPDYWTSLSDFTASASDIRFPGATVASFSIAGKQDELSPIEVSGSLTARGLEARASMENMLLPALNAYVSPLLGYDLTAGRLGFDVTVAPAPPLLAATANVELRGVEVRQTGVDVIQQQSGVPLPIALSLISKRPGEINLTLPVTFDTKARRVALGSIVGQAVRNAIVTALTSPLRMLGSLFGKSGAPHAFAIDPIPFAPGSGELDAAGAARVAEIARILSAHPGLVLVALPQLTADDLAAAGDDAKALAEARSAAVREALTGDDADPRLPADQLLLVAWRPPSGAAPVGPPGMYVELQDQP